MLQDTITLEERYKKFIETVCETEVIWGLKNEDGFATSDSTEFEDEDGFPLDLICFWSQKALAKACAIEAWDDYVPTEIPLSEFIENWCVGMSDDGVFAGIDFDSNMFGYEQETLQVVLDLHAELKKHNKSILFKKFKHIEELTDVIEKLMAESD